MSDNDFVSCGLDYAITPDLHECVTEALQLNYSFIVTPIFHPRFRSHHVDENAGGFTRSDLVVSTQDWTSRIVGRLSSYLTVDSEVPVIRQRHEDTLNEELYYCRGLGLPAIMLTLTGRKNNNLARILQTFNERCHHSTLIWVQVPMVDSRALKTYSETDNSEFPWNEPWYWWSEFHERLDFDKKVGLVLELSAELPSQEVLKRWLGEPVRALIVPTSLFHNNKKGYPILSHVHQDFVVSMMEHEAQIIVSGARRSNPERYVQFMNRIWRRRPNPAEDPMHSYAKGWEDYLQVPLQPLADNLDTHTYSVFEKDPVKYDQYQKAIVEALIDIRIKESEPNRASALKCKDTKACKETKELVQVADKTKKEKNDKTITVMVLGAGRGPLVRATLNAADITNTNVQVMAVEKNPCAVVVLAAQVREIWKNRNVVLIPGDMRHINLFPKADIIVSELLGSWGDNELSPECLDGAAGLLKPGGVSIPSAYNSYVAPISSSRLWAAAKVAGGTSNNKDKNLETLWVVYMQSRHHIGEPKMLFTFNHPARGERDLNGQEMTDYRGLPLTDNRRSSTILWNVQQDSVMHGFGGFFDCSLYGTEMISIVPSTHSPGMISWFPIFIPIKTPLRVQKGDIITATFWRCVDPRRVWYEWLVEVGNRATPIHNCNGRSSEMLL